MPLLHRQASPAVKGLAAVSIGTRQLMAAAYADGSLRLWDLLRQACVLHELLKPDSTTVEAMAPTRLRFAAPPPDEYRRPGKLVVQFDRPEGRLSTRCQYTLPWTVCAVSKQAALAHSRGQQSVLRRAGGQDSHFAVFELNGEASSDGTSISALSLQQVRSSHKPSLSVSRTTGAITCEQYLHGGHQTPSTGTQFTRAQTRTACTAQNERSRKVRLSTRQVAILERAGATSAAGPAGDLAARQRPAGRVRAWALGHDGGVFAMDEAAVSRGVRGADARLLGDDISELTSAAEAQLQLQVPPPTDPHLSRSLSSTTVPCFVYRRRH